MRKEDDGTCLRPDRPQPTQAPLPSSRSVADMSWPRGRKTGLAALPVEGRLPGFDGATGWLNSAPLAHRRPAREGRPGRFLDVHVHQLAPDARLPPRVGREVPGARPGRRRRSHAGVPVREGRRQRSPGRDGHEGRVSDRARPRLRGLAVLSATGTGLPLYFADAEGRIRHHQFGEGEYEMCERVIQQLLREAGRDDVPGDIVSPPDDGVEAQADWSNLESPETYVGHQQGHNFASPGGASSGEPRAYSLPEMLKLNSWALAGTWAVESRAVVLDDLGGAIAFRFHARDVNLVLRSRTGDAVPFRVRIDGAPPGTAHGLDVDARATERWFSRASTSSSGNRAPLPIAPSTSHSSKPASRPTCSPSGRWGSGDGVGVPGSRRGGAAPSSSRPCSSGCDRRRLGRGRPCAGVE